MSNIIYFFIGLLSILFIYFIPDLFHTNLGNFLLLTILILLCLYIRNFKLGLYLAMVFILFIGISRYSNTGGNHIRVTENFDTQNVWTQSTLDNVKKVATIYTQNNNPSMKRDIDVPYGSISDVTEKVNNIISMNEKWATDIEAQTYITNGGVWNWDTPTINATVTYLQTIPRFQQYSITDINKFINTYLQPTFSQSFMKSQMNNIPNGQLYTYLQPEELHTVFK